MCFSFLLPLATRNFLTTPCPNVSNDLLTGPQLVTCAGAVTTVALAPVLLPFLGSVNWTQVATAAVGGHFLRKELSKLDP